MGTQESAKYGMRDGKLMNLTHGYEVKTSKKRSNAGTMNPFSKDNRYDEMGAILVEWWVGVLLTAIGFGFAVWIIFWA